MRRIYAVKKYEIEYGESFNHDTAILRTLVSDFEEEYETDSLITFGDYEFYESGIYQFDRSLFKEMLLWAETMDESYFKDMLDHPDAKVVIMFFLNNLYLAGDLNDDVVTVDIF